jgi:hypothetical protein
VSSALYGSGNRGRLSGPSGSLLHVRVQFAVFSKVICNFPYSEFGVGTSVIHEIKRDSLVADLLLSVFSTAVQGRFLDPKPPDYDEAKALQLLRSRY